MNFFMADVQTGVGPFVAAYLASQHWNPRDVGFAMTLGGMVTVVTGPFAGAVVDHARNKRGLVAAAMGVLACGAMLIGTNARPLCIVPAQLLIGLAGAFLGPTVAAITLGIVGAKSFDRQFGRNQSFNSAGNVFTAGLLALSSWLLGAHSIFFVSASLTLPTLFMLHRINSSAIDFDRARGSAGKSHEQSTAGHWKTLCADRTLLIFLGCVFLFHLANAAMLPQLGELLSKDDVKTATVFMSASIVVTQAVISCSAAWIGRLAGRIGRRPLLLAGFGVLPIRGVLYTLTHTTALLLAIQVLDGVANAIFGVVSILVIADRMQRTGHFNLAQGALGTCVGLGAALSTSVGGLLIHRYGFPVSFLGLAAIALLAVTLLWFGVPETLRSSRKSMASAC